MNTMQIFNNEQFGEVRIINKDGEIFFVARDVATALGYSKPETSVRDRVNERDTEKCGVSDANGHTQQMLCINEAGLYSLIFGSKLESARSFQDWVTHDVLPSIRKNGSYTLSQAKPKLPSTTREQIRLLAQANEETNQRLDHLETSVKEMREELPLFPVELERITGAVKKKGTEVLGGKDSLAYHDRSISQTVYRDIYREIYRNFNVTSYKLLRRTDLSRVEDIIFQYEAPIFLSDQIRNRNVA